jgi:hypothetical protein
MSKRLIVSLFASAFSALVVLPPVSVMAQDKPPQTPPAERGERPQRGGDRGGAAPIERIIELTRELELTEATDRIVLNAIELGIRRVSVDGTDVGFSLDQATERLIVDAAVAAGEAELHIEFDGVLNDKLHGWYRSTYREAGGVEHVISARAAESVEARTMKPGTPARLPL